ncbi:PAS domain S-box protein [Azospirillum thermophilum]|uniref:histidine kinase n=1 Tax=Azospirillum thermophilum TaxID=2202148 RepID=A0A2S2CMF1_9PROT|nr:PAS domain S-box protein [Azospirillum thermophilum]AWK85550.1 hybrid sensor histidine kinase/response regulator [Azospirillum thermophilum]
MSLLHRLLLLVFLALVPAAVIEIHNEIQLRAAREADVREGLLRLAGLFAGEQERLVEGIRQILFGISQAAVVQEGRVRECQAYLDRLRPGLPPFLRIGVTDRAGDLRCSSDHETVGMPVGDRQHVRDAIAGGGFVVGETIDTRPGGRSVLPMALAVQDEGGAVTGVVTALIDLAWLTRLLAQRPLPPDTVVMLFDRRGTVVARIPEAPREIGRPLPDGQFEALTAGRDPFVAEWAPADGQARLFGVVPFVGGIPGLGVAVSVGRAHAMGPIEDAMVSALAVIAVVAAATLAAAWWGGNRFLRRPAAALVEAALRWRGGDLSARTGLAGERSEIGTIGRAFDGMAEALQRQAALRDEANALAHRAAAVLSSTTDGVFEVDRDWKVTFMNDRARELLGDGHDLTGHRLEETFPGAGRSVFAEQFRRAVQGMATVSFEAFYPPQSAWYAVRAFPSRDGLAVFFQDITELRQAEAARRRSEERFRAIFELAAVGIERLDPAGRYLDVNAKLCAILGYRRDELLGMSFLDLTDPDDLQAEQALLDRLTAGEIPSYAIEKRYRRRDGQVVWVRVTSSRVVVGATDEIGRIAIVEDITERKAMEQELRSAKDEAERANLAKSKFLAAASHDLRQPLQSLFFFSASLDPHVRSAAGREQLRHLHQGLDAMKELLESLLDVSRLDAGAVTPTMEDFAVSEILDSIDAAYAPLAAEKGLLWRVEGCEVPVRSDRLLLGRLVRNLVENAIRYTDSGTVRLRCRHEGERVAIEVQDTGIGIPPDHLERIFEEFHQVGNPERDRTQGLGLGLAIVRRLSHLLGHPVEVRSIHGRGSAFRVLVPVGQKAMPAAVAEPLRPDGRGRLAVLVDDDAIVLMGLRTVLSEWGYTVLAADGADQAMERLRAQARRPDIVIADYRLREGRVGTEVIRKVRERYGPEVPGVILTGETGTDCLLDAAAHGLPVIHKPVTPRELCMAVEQQLQAAV